MIVRNIEDDIKVGLKVRATAHGWSMEEEVRQILRAAVSAQEPARAQLGSRIAARFAGDGLTQALPEFHGQAIEPMGFSA
ncbi:MAG: toxin-antitoxin system [Comamonadaceae bacterium CG12_big_fil_rev_8_21_14_0_65_59_15]|nr:MAG: toxin-antitoxin system [Comamonadaceae bacterium CG12_big_fil_rev_8_21_14_0_65_59_15]